MNNSSCVGIFILLISIGLTLAAFIDPYDVTKDVQKYGNQFQTVVVNDVGNLTNIVDQLDDPKDPADILSGLGHLIEQFDYSYTKFSDALQDLIDESVQALNQNTYNFNVDDIYVPNSIIERNIALCNDTKITIDNLLAVIHNLYANAQTVITQINATTVHGGVAALPDALAEELLGAIGQLSSLNGEISKFMGILVSNVKSFIADNRHQLRKDQILEPVHQYEKIMNVLSKICKQLQKYFKKLIPKKYVIGKTSSRVLIDLKEAYPNAVQVLEDCRDLYAATEATMSSILAILQIYGEPNYGLGKPEFGVLTMPPTLLPLPPAPQSLNPPTGQMAQSPQTNVQSSSSLNSYPSQYLYSSSTPSTSSASIASSTSSSSLAPAAAVAAAAAQANAAVTS